jgi:hypothetical protein
MTKKQQKIWDEKLEYVDTLTDKLGLHVDKGIRETVAALHLFNIHTTASHEGKMHRYPVPYIDVDTVQTWPLYSQLEKCKSPHQKRKIENMILVKSLDEIRKVDKLLREFYSMRKVTYEVRLAISSYRLGWNRVQSLGADFQDSEKNKKIRNQRLMRFQKEMRSFTKFLKIKYFSKV